MRLHFIAVAAVIAAVCAAPVSADRIIFAPTGTVLAPGELKAEAAFGKSNDRIYWAGIGLRRLEINAIRLDGTTKLAGTPNADVFGAELGILPETTLTPGLGVGVWDIGSDTDDGRGYYAALTKVVPLTKELPLPIHDIRVHLGYGVQGIHGAFVGADAGLPLGFTIAAEYFQKKTNVALGWNILPALQLRGSILDGDVFYGIRFTSPL